MTESKDYTFDTPEGPLTITVTPVNESLGAGMVYSTGVYKLHEGGVGLGDMIFDENGDWEYTGIDDELSHGQLMEIAAFIKQENSKDGLSM